MKKNIYVSIICFFLLVMMFSGVMIYRHFKEENPEEFEHIVSLQKTLFDELEKNNPNIAEEIKKLHNTHS